YCEYGWLVFGRPKYSLAISEHKSSAESIHGDIRVGQKSAHSRPAAAHEFQARPRSTRAGVAAAPRLECRVAIQSADTGSGHFVRNSHHHHTPNARQDR